MDLTDPAVRCDLVGRLAGLYAGGPVILGPGVLAAFTSKVAELRGHGCRVLVLSTARGAGPVPAADECTVVELETPVTRLVTDEMLLAQDLGPYAAPRALEMPSSSRMRTPLRGKDDFTLTRRSGEPSLVSGSPMSSRARRPSVAPALRSELGCERAGQPPGRVFVDRSGSLEVCRL